MLSTKAEKLLASLLLASLVSLPIAGKLLWDKGLKEGIEAYHQQCHVGGYIIDNKGNTVVCAPLSKLPKEEQNAYKLHS